VTCVTLTLQFIISLNIISKYSAQLEPVTNKLQGKSIDLCSVLNYIQDLLTIFNNNREQTDIMFNSTFNNSLCVAEIKNTCITKKKINQIMRQIWLNAITDFLTLFHI